MNYQGLVNLPEERAIMTHPWVSLGGTFSPDELEKLKAYCSTLKPEIAKITANEGILDERRKSMTCYVHPQPENLWIFDKLNGALEYINARWYGYDLNGYSAFQYTEYEVGGKYHWHQDTFLGVIKKIDGGTFQPRKLSMSLLLNEDYEGGELEIIDGDPDYPSGTPKKAGMMIAFPSIMIHRVKPVTKGVRKSIVVWVLGPKFR